MKFVYIKPGTFQMGSPESEEGRSSNEKQHTVTLTQGFYMQTTEVTKRQWFAIMEKGPSYFKSCGDDCPVIKIPWHDAQAFIQKLNQKEGGNEYRLPTEAEWEYAARAGSTTAFANGEISELQCGNDPNLSAIGWYCGNSGQSFDRSIYPVAQKNPNGWGLFDMHGNVSEWCGDWYGDYPSGPVIDPTGPLSGSYRVIRGGSYHRHAGDCRSAVRNWWNPVKPNGEVGFRILKIQ
jgi:formylglycine-generating enzyme required for sulfatase activity